MRAWRRILVLRRSRPARARGLKPEQPAYTSRGADVAPRAGAWIETSRQVQSGRDDCPSRPARARGLKLHAKSKVAVTIARRAPRGRVD